VHMTRFFLQAGQNSTDLVAEYQESQMLPGG